MEHVGSFLVHLHQWKIRAAFGGAGDYGIVRLEIRFPIRGGRLRARGEPRDYGSGRQSAAGYRHEAPGNGEVARARGGWKSRAKCRCSFRRRATIRPNSEWDYFAKQRRIDSHDGREWR